MGSSTCNLMKPLGTVAQEAQRCMRTKLDRKQVPLGEGYALHFLERALLLCRSCVTLRMQGVAYAKAHAVEHGPIILEMDTYRYHGHSMSDPGSTYRTRDEITQIRTQRDPVEHIKKLLLDRGLVDAADIKKSEKVCCFAFSHKAWLVDVTLR